MKKTIAVWSPVSGTGVTFLSIAICQALGDAGKRVLLLDYDLKSPSLSFYLQSEDVVHSLDNLLPFTAGLGLTPDILESNLQKFESFFFLRGTNQPEQAPYFEIDNLTNIIDVAGPMFDFIVIDSHSIIDNVGTYVALNKADTVFLVLDKNVISIQRYEKMKPLLAKHYDLAKFSLLINKSAKNTNMSTKDIENFVGHALLAVFPDLGYDFINSVNQGRWSSYIKGPLSQAKQYREAVRTLIKEEIGTEQKRPFLSFR